METQGHHLIVDFHGCPREVLTDAAYLEQALRDAAEKAKTTIIAVRFHCRSPEGVSGVIVISESHLSIHTWPEQGYAAVDFYTCGDGDPWAAFEVLREALRSSRASLLTINRGLGNNTPCTVKQDTWSPDSNAKAHSLSPGSG